MAIFNAWCDRVPMLIFGATGPVDTVHRRPWIDWIHTARDQGALVRGYTKWDDQPASPIAAREAVLRANWLANTAPRGPTYVNLDAGMQESKLADPVPPIDSKRFMKAYRESIDYLYSSNPQVMKDYAEFARVPEPMAKRVRDEFFPKSLVNPDQIHGLDTLIPEAVNLKFIPAPLNKEQIAELIQISPRK